MYKIRVENNKKKKEFKKKTLPLAEEKYTSLIEEFKFKKGEFHIFILEEYIPNKYKVINQKIIVN